MNRTLEMLFGDAQRKIGMPCEMAAPYGLCDCRQGRDPCNCNGKVGSPCHIRGVLDFDRVMHGEPVSKGHCNNLKGIYGADMYAPTAVQVLRTETATLRRRVKIYAAVALLGWAAVVVMGVVL